MRDKTKVLQGQTTYITFLSHLVSYLFHRRTSNLSALSRLLGWVTVYRFGLPGIIYRQQEQFTGETNTAYFGALNLEIVLLDVSSMG